MTSHFMEHVWLYYHKRPLISCTYVCLIILYSAHIRNSWRHTFVLHIIISSCTEIRQTNVERFFKLLSLKPIWEWHTDCPVPRHQGRLKRKARQWPALWSSSGWPRWGSSCQSHGSCSVRTSPRSPSCGCLHYTIIRKRLSTKSALVQNIRHKVFKI